MTEDWTRYLHERTDDEVGRESWNLRKGIELQAIVVNYGTEHPVPIIHRAGCAHQSQSVKAGNGDQWSPLEGKLGDVFVAEWAAYVRDTPRHYGFCMTTVLEHVPGSAGLCSTPLIHRTQLHNHRPRTCECFDED